MPGKMVGASVNSNYATGAVPVFASNQRSSGDNQGLWWPPKWPHDNLTKRELQELLLSKTANLGRKALAAEAVLGPPRNGASARCCSAAPLGGGSREQP